MNRNRWLFVSALVLTALILGMLLFIKIRAAEQSAILNSYQAASSTSTPNSNNCGTTYVGGEIATISGNTVSLYDRYSSTTARLILATSTNYFDIAPGTAMPSSSLLRIGQVVTAYGNNCGTPPVMIAEYLQKNRTVADISPPPGWYAHRVAYAKIIFTKQEELVMASDTPAWVFGALASGEQIQVLALEPHGSPQTWAWGNIGLNDGTGRTGTPKTGWGMLNGYQTLQAENVPNKGDFSYIVFSTTTVSFFFLHPYPNPTDLTLLKTMVRNFVVGL